jgi:hypothetical protein
MKNISVSSDFIFYYGNSVEVSIKINIEIDVEIFVDKID